MEKPLMSFHAIGRTFHSPHGDVRALSEFSADLYPGDMVALMGPSGSGKSTALSIGGLMLAPTSGHLLIKGKPAPAEEKQRAALRNSFVSLIHQEYAVIEDISAVANVALPLEYADKRLPRAKCTALAQ